MRSGTYIDVREQHTHSLTKKKHGKNFAVLVCASWTRPIISWRIGVLYEPYAIRISYVLWLSGHE